MPHTRRCEYGSFAATDKERLADLISALENSEIKAILCGRGGYGCVHLLSEELQKLVAANPKWIIGFSDVSALHALWLKAGVKSVHASMAKQLTLYNPDNQSGAALDIALSENLNVSDAEELRYCTDLMFSILQGTEKEIDFKADGGHRIISGKAEGVIVGGNLAVLNGLAGTPWDILSPEYLKGKILFLEDVGEKIYQVERMLKRLQLAGSLNSVSGIIFGNFTDYKPDRNFDSMEQMIRVRLEEWGIECPVAIDIPIGHTHFNLPIPEGSRATLDINSNGVDLRINLAAPLNKNATKLTRKKS